MKLEEERSFLKKTVRGSQKPSQATKRGRITVPVFKQGKIA